ncbi:MAG: hypothetical protein ISS31_04425 [Kiritimatiellae bacterium]|nr:hypothetical protein [Kiritimatiellia bacterium]
MNDDHIALLSRIAGEIDSLFTMTLLGRVKGDASDRVGRWQAAYEMNGLNFTHAKEDALLLRELVAAGFLASTGGRTKGSSWGLTWKGIVATQPPDLKPIEMLVDLATLAEMAEPAGRRSGLPDDWQVVHGYRLAPAALDWIKGKDCDAYNHQLGQAATSLAPLLIMGWVDSFTDHDAAIWSAYVTTAGRAVLDDLPALDEPCGTLYDYDAWSTGYDAAFSVYPSRKSPPAVSNMVTRRLSAGGAWEAYDKKTKAKLHAELKAAAQIAKKTISDRQEAGRANHKPVDPAEGQDDEHHGATAAGQSDDDGRPQSGR